VTGFSPASTFLGGWFDAARNALDWVEKFSGRPSPGDDTVLKISPVSQPDRSYFVRVGTVRASTPAPSVPQQDALFAPDPRSALD
jgi:hypothetical protein